MVGAKNCPCSQGSWRHQASRLSAFAAARVRRNAAGKRAQKREKLPAPLQPHAETRRGSCSPKTLSLPWCACTGVQLRYFSTHASNSTQPQATGGESAPRDFGLTHHWKAGWKHEENYEFLLTEAATAKTKHITKGPIKNIPTSRRHRPRGHTIHPGRIRKHDTPKIKAKRHKVRTLSKTRAQNTVQRCSEMPRWHTT